MPEPNVSPAPAPSAPPPAARSPDPGLVIGSNPAISEPQRRWAEERARIQESDVWQHDPTRTVMKKAADGTVSAVPRNGADGAPSEPAPGDQPKPGEPQLAPRDSSNRVQLTKDVAVTEEELHALLAHKAAADSAKLSTPQPNEYKLEFPHDYVLPAGVEWKWNEADPLLARAREFASANNMTQDTFSRLLGLHAASRMAEMQEFNTARENQVKLLGDNANARVDAVRAWMKSVVPEHFNDLARVLEMAPTASTVKALEVLAHRWVNQGGSSFSGAYREPNIPGKVSQETYDSYSYAQKLDYASKFDQSRR
jgi:hypothetical protein